VEPRLRLNEFKTLYKAWKRGIPYWDHLLLGLLYWVEEKIIDYRVKTTVDEAIKEVVQRASELPLPPLPDMVTPVYRESPSDTSTSLPEMRLTAPWYVSPDDTVEGR
jgi:hypothetical protein